MNDFIELEQRAIQIRQKYEKLEQTNYGRDWTGEELMLGFMKDVGDLAKLIQAKEGVRNVDDVDGKLAHELSDCLWSVMVIANKYDVDLKKSFLTTMDELEKRFEN